MRPGLMEIGVIALVILIIFVMTRIMRQGQNAGSKGGTSHGEKGDVVKAGRTRHSSLRNTGIVLVVIGIIFLLFCASFLRWFFGAYIGALVIIALGAVIIFIARRR